MSSWKEGIRLIEEIVVKAEGLEKTYFMGKVSVPALRGVNLAFRRGEFVVVMGLQGLERLLYST